MMLNNADWLLKLNYVELLREVGACFSVNNMLRAECYKQRMEKGLSFLEFNYMIMQSYDFYYMFQHYGCNMQFGGDDQWSNMLGGTELIRRKLGKDAHAMTITSAEHPRATRWARPPAAPCGWTPTRPAPSISTSTGATWSDADVLKCIRMLTFLPLEQIDEMDAWEGSQLNKAKEILAYELTKMVHGEEEAKKAQEGARALFGAGADTANMPTTQLAEEDFTDGQIAVLDLLVKTGLASSKGEGRRLIQQGGLTVAEEKVTDINKTFPKADFRSRPGHQEGQESVPQGHCIKARIAHKKGTAWNQSCTLSVFIGECITAAPPGWRPAPCRNPPLSPAGKSPLPRW